MKKLSFRKEYQNIVKDKIKEFMYPFENNEEKINGIKWVDKLKNKLFKEHNCIFDEYLHENYIHLIIKWGK